ncbi:MAG: outer membrane protein assembly factor BamC [Mariprofundaceae bacterium]|nr:outer membrane protein assembly factor BamC [Mariprofundaceae bacterium]
MIWKVDDNKPDYARGSQDSSQAKGRPPLEVPPELRRDVEVPMPDEVAVNAARGDVKMTKEEKAAIAGKAVSLDTRLYDVSPAKVFSTALDSMTALNMPVQSVDSPSGTITTDWIRKGTATYMSAAMNVFGGGQVPTRYRFIVRVFRTPDGKSELQVRTLGQKYENRHWVHAAIKRKVVNELFSAVEERLALPSPASTPPESMSSEPATITNP